MRRTEHIDLGSVDIPTLPLPQTGERLLRDSEAIGLALRLRSSGARTWVALHTQDGKTKRRSLGDALSVPLPLARTLHSTCAPSTPHTPAVPARYPATASVRDLMAGYLVFGGAGRWKPSTGKCMESVFRLHIDPALGHMAVRDLARHDVIRWHSELALRTTASRMGLSTLSGLMLYAEDHGLRVPGSNPCKGLRKKAQSTRGSHLPSRTIARLWTTLDRMQNDFPDACDAVRLLMLTGARKGEILGLRWNLIAEARAVLEQSKTGPRTIWLNSPARNILRERHSRIAGEWVFPAPRATGPRTSILYPWSTIRTEAGCPALRLHDLRHHYAAVGVSNGIDLKLVGSLLGHQDIDSTLIYAHLATASLVKSAGRVSGLIDQAMRGGQGPGKDRHRPPTLAALPLTCASGNAAEVHHG